MFTITSHESKNSTWQQLEISNFLINGKNEINKILDIIKLYKCDNIYVEFDGGYDQFLLTEKIRNFEKEPKFVLSNPKTSNKVRYTTTFSHIEDVVLLAGKNGYYLEIYNGDKINWLQFLYYKLRENNIDFQPKFFEPDFKLVLNKNIGEHVFKFRKGIINTEKLNELIK